MSQERIDYLTKRIDLYKGLVTTSWNLLNNGYTTDTVILANRRLNYDHRKKELARMETALLSLQNSNNEKTIP